MRLLQKPFKNAKKGQIIEVTFDKPTNIKFMTADNFGKYKKGKTHTFYGGWQEDSPVEFTIPKNGTWHAVIEKGTFNNPLEVSGNAVISSGPETLAPVDESHEIEESSAIEVDEEPQEDTKKEVYAEVENEEENNEEENDEEEESKEE